MKLLKNVFVLALAAVAGIYLLNPTWGVFELLPDNIPGVGNVDEGLAVLILLNSTRYFGLDLTRFLSRGQETNTTQSR
jgi:hypothetical protein